MQKSIWLSLTALLSMVISLTVCATPPKPTATDGLTGSDVKSVGFFSMDDYKVAMVNSGGQGSNPQYNFSTAYFKSDGDKTYVLVLMELSDGRLGEMLTGGDNSFVRTGLYNQEGRKVVDENDESFNYIYIDDQNNLQYCSFGNCGNNEIIGYTAVFINTNVGSSTDFPSKDDGNYFSEFEVHANVDYDVNNDGTISGDEKGFTSATCENSSDCNPDCLTGNCGTTSTPPPSNAGGNIPIDGGLGFLVAAGLGYGVYKKRK